MAEPKARFSLLRVGGCLLLLLGPPILWIWVNYPHHQPRPRPRTCVRNLRQLGLAVRMYVQDYDDTMPRVEDWARTTMPYVKNELIYHCPEAENESGLSYGMNRDLSLAPMAQFEDEQGETVMLFDGQMGVVIERHEDGANYAFLDGHVDWMENPPEGLPTLSTEQERASEQ